MNDVYVATLASDIIQLIESFNFYHNMGDHVMYRARAAEIQDLATVLLNEVEE